MKDFFTKLWVNIKGDFIFVFLGAVIGYFIVTLAFNRGTRYGYVRGYGDGIDRALDTVSKIVQKQVDSDTSSTNLTIQSTDTVSVTLSRKTLLPKK